MSEARIHGALERIEKALARIETQAALARTAARTDSELAKRHEALKSRVADNLAELDKLIVWLKQLRPDVVHLTNSMLSGRGDFWAGGGA